MYRTRVLVFMAMFVGLANSFSWDIVVGFERRLEFYYNGILTNTEDIPSASFINAITYDSVQNRLLFVHDNYPNIILSSFDLSSRKMQLLVTRRTTKYLVSIAYDPVTELLFWTLGKDIYAYSLRPESNMAVDGYLVVTMNNQVLDIAVDGCEGYIYLATDNEIERVWFDGSSREVLIKYNSWRLSLVIDQQTQKMYWIDVMADESEIHIESADFNGKNRRKLYIARNESVANSLAVSKDFIYWNGYDQMAIWQLPKNPPRDAEAKRFLTSTTLCFYCNRIAAHYTNKEQTQAVKGCEVLKNLKPNPPVVNFTDEILFCVHGRKVSGKPRCECTQGYIGERCDVSICHNYCLQGDCYTSGEEQPKCRCEAGYSGERCEVNDCQEFCLNNGVCTWDEEGERICECKEGYDGERCEVPLQSGNEIEDQSCSLPQPDLSESVLGDFQTEIISILQKTLEPIRDDISSTKNQTNDIKSSIDALLADLKAMEKKVSQVQQNCDNIEPETSTRL